MALADRIRAAAQAFVGVSVYQPPPMAGMPDLDDHNVQAMRTMQGGNLQPPSCTKTEWYHSDLLTASAFADGGDMRLIAQLWKASKADGVIGGLRATRTAGLVALPKTFRGFKRAVTALKPDDEERCLFDEMFPPSELSKLADDGLGCGIGVAELIPVREREHPVMRALDPQFLVYRFNEGRWYYRSTAGLLPIFPGDGRWILHTPGGSLEPWHGGIWRAVGRSFITKDFAILHRGNFSGKLANPARVVTVPNATSEPQRASALQELISWGINKCFVLPVGHEIDLLESNGRGWEVYGKEIETADLEAMISIAGQVVTVTGGTGFANAGIHEAIRADLIQQTGDSLAHTINTQGLPVWQAKKFGLDTVLSKPVRVGWDTSRPMDRTAEAASLSGAAAAATALVPAGHSADLAVDVQELFTRFGVPTTDDPAALARMKEAKAAATALPAPGAPGAPGAPAAKADKPPAQQGKAWGKEQEPPTLADEDDAHDE